MEQQEQIWIRCLLQGEKERNLWVFFSVKLVLGTAPPNVNVRASIQLVGSHSVSFWLNQVPGKAWQLSEFKWNQPFG